MILVTGGSGFLGQHLVRYLSAQGVRVRALYNEHAPGAALAQLQGVEWMQCDLLDVYAVAEAMGGCTDIYHCAGMVTFNPRLRDKMLHFNPESTANVVNEALIQDVRKMVYVSSVAALGRSGDTGKLIDEEQEWGENKYNSAYGISKFMAENEVWRGIGEGLCAVIVNPSVILGPGNWDSGSSQLMSVVNKEFPFYTNGVNAWVGIQDVVHAMTMLMASDVEAERFIVSAGNYSFREIFEMMAEAIGKRPPRIYAGSFITGLIWRLGGLYGRITGKNVAITKETARNAHGSSKYNNEKLLRVFPHFSYMPMVESIKYMAEAFVRTQEGKDINQ